MANFIALPEGTELVGDFRIQRVLGAGGFGVTYLADELALGRAVTIKEYFPSDFAARGGGFDAVPRSENCAGDYKWGLDRFIEEAQTLARFDHPTSSASIAISAPTTPATWCCSSRRGRASRPG
jgi:serine/threonine protein kinase